MLIYLAKKRKKERKDEVKVLGFKGLGERLELFFEACHSLWAQSNCFQVKRGSLLEEGCRTIGWNLPRSMFLFLRSILRVYTRFAGAAGFPSEITLNVVIILLTCIDLEIRRDFYCNGKFGYCNGKFGLTLRRVCGFAGFCAHGSSSKGNEPNLLVL